MQNYIKREFRSQLAWVMVAILIAAIQLINTTVYLAASSAFVIAAVLSRNPALLPAIVISCVDRAELVSTVEYWLGERDIALFRIAGFPLSIRMITALVVMTTGVVGLLFASGRRASGQQVLCLLLWLIGAPIAAYCALLGREEFYEGWTRSLRHYITFGGFFFGLLIAPHMRAIQGEALLKSLRVVLYPFAALALFGAVTSHLIFVTVGLLGTIASCGLTEKSGERILGFVLMVVVFIIALRSTFTVAGIAVCAVLLVILKQWLRQDARPSSAGARASALVATVFLSSTIFVMITAMTAEVQVGVDQNIRTLRVETTLAERLGAKIFADRNMLWRPAIEQVLSSKSVFVPSGRPLELKSIYVEAQLWVFGPHNSYLDVLRNSGPIGGSLLIAAIGLALWLTAKGVLAANTPRSAVVLGTSALAITFVGMTVGDFPIDINVGPFIWIIAGICAGSPGVAQIAHRR